MSSAMMAYRKIFNQAKHVVVLTGAGISAESGIPTFRGAGGLWRQFNATDLATESAFRQSPSLVWEFYHYRRELVRTKQPNPGHLALADAEKRFKNQGKNFTLITQNVDRLHIRAGSRNVIEMHGNLFTVRCTSCGHIEENNDSPICEALRNRGSPTETGSTIPVQDLPRCRQCRSLVRPHVVWFGEAIARENMNKIEEALETCDLFVVIGTSSVVYPAAGFASLVATLSVPVAEINMETTPSTSVAKFHFEGLASELVPKLFGENDDENTGITN